MPIDLKTLFKTPGLGQDGSIGDQLGAPTLGLPGFVPELYDPSLSDAAAADSVTSNARLHGGGGAATVVTTAAPTPTTVSVGTGFSIVLNWDTSVGGAPSAFTTAVIKAATYLAGQFSDAVTMSLNIGYGEVGGSALGSGALASTQTYLSSTSYSSLQGALKKDATSASDTSAVASLPGASPVAGNYWLTTAEAKALGLASGTGTDANIGFSNAYGFTYDPTTGVTAGTYDFNATALHEMSEAMGRMLLTGGTIGTYTNSYVALDLFHFSAPAARTFTASAGGYFSVDNGTTNLGTFNTVGGGDAGDWASSMVNDAADAFGTPGAVETFSNADLTTLDVVGWNRVGQSVPTPPPSTSTPTGVTMAAATASLNGAQGSSGLSGRASLATFRQVGGAAGDTYSYALGGTGAGAFTLNTASSVATLAAGSAGVAGAAGGRLYALTVTPKDVTSGKSGPASALDVIVGGSAADTVSVATLTGALGAATPTFVYGLAGADSISAAGMTGNVWIDGGAGANRLTGGAGVNTYLYGATGDSTATAMDVITNFSATDLIDLTGLGVRLSVTGAASTTLAARSVGWASSGGNTFVYVNSSTASESLGAANMKIELLGSVPLVGGNITHL